MEGGFFMKNHIQLNIFTFFKIAGWCILLTSIIDVIADIRTNIINGASALSTLAHQPIGETAMVVAAIIALVIISALLGSKIEKALPRVPTMPRTMNFKIKDFVLAIVKCAIVMNTAFGFLDKYFSIFGNAFVVFAKVFATFVAPLPFTISITLKFYYLQMYLSVVAIIAYVVYLKYFKTILTARGYDDIVRYTYDSIYFTKIRQYIVTLYMMIHIYIVPLFKPIEYKQTAQ